MISELPREPARAGHAVNRHVHTDRKIIYGAALNLRLPAVRNQQCPPPVTQRWEINKTPRKWQFFDKTALRRFRPQRLSVR